MKKFITLYMAISIVSVGWGGTASFRVAADDVKSSYEYSDIITIELVADFPVGQLGIDYVYGEPTASDPDLHDSFTQSPLSPGDIINSGDVLLQSIAGGVASEDIPAGEVLWSSEYHYPYTPYSTIITISATGVIISDLCYTEYTESIEPMEIHIIIVEPTTMAFVGLGSLLLRRRK